MHSHTHTQAWTHTYACIYNNWVYNRYIYTMYIIDTYIQLVIDTLLYSSIPYYNRYN